MHYSCLIVDDEKELASSTNTYLNAMGVNSYCVFDAKSCLEFLEHNDCSLILLDINLGDDSGFELCKKLRQDMDIPILFISARLSEDDMMVALNIGGDDYICKPYSLGVLCAKVKAVLNRYERAVQVKQNDRIQLGNAIVDLGAGFILRHNEEYRLKGMELKLLRYFIEHKNRVIKKEDLFRDVWEDSFTGDGTLNVHIRHLREKLEDNPGEPMCIKTVWGVGYIFEMRE